MRVRWILPVGAAAAVASAGFVCATPAAALACTPSYTGSGPTVTVQPDYTHPLKSQVGYDSSDVDIEVHPCGA
ncbi:MAG: hypothetical protein JWP11_793 [Frankiales bacterium]|jgi:hypothetical protein|nr:hypothetical protein [Frankiales bacterium]